jgi:hypothetical protein
MKIIGIVLCIPMFLSLTTEPPKPVHRPYLEIVFERLVEAESSWDRWAVSDKGAIGICQITDIGLKEYNRVFKTNLKMYQLWDTNISYNVGWGYFTNVLGRLDNDIVKGVNAYNMGMGNTHNGLYYGPYIDKIIPGEWLTYLVKNNVYWDGRNVIKIKRRKYVRIGNKYKVSPIP